MSSPKYHREQAQILAGLALSTQDATKADQFNLAAMEHLDRARVLDGGDMGPSQPPAPAADEMDRA